MSREMPRYLKVCSGFEVHKLAFGLFEVKLDSIRGIMDGMYVMERHSIVDSLMCKWLFSPWSASKR